MSGGPASPLIVAVVLVYNRWDRLPRCLPALRASTYPALGILVVDNGSTTRPPESTTGLLAGLETIRTPENLGYAGGNNVGIRWAMERGAEYVLLLNDDAYVRPDTISRLVGRMEGNLHAGAMGPLVLYGATPDMVQSAGGVWSRQRQWALHRGRGERDRGQFQEPLEADFIDGSCILLRVAALSKVGLLDEGFFLYYEEAELCARFRAAGFTCIVDPTAKVEHEGPPGGSRGSPVTSYFSHRNRFLYLRRTSRGFSRVARIAWALGTEISLVGQLVSAPRDAWVRARARGVLDGVLGREGGGPPWIFGA